MAARQFTVFLAQLWRGALDGLAGGAGIPGAANDGPPARPPVSGVIVPFPRRYPARLSRPGTGLGGVLTKPRSRCRHMVAALWNLPRTRGAFIVQQLVAIAVAVSLGALFDRIWR